VRPNRIDLVVKHRLAEHLGTAEVSDWSFEPAQRVECSFMYFLKLMQGSPVSTRCGERRARGDS
jgi:hypothetical protein